MKSSYIKSLEAENSRQHGVESRARKFHDPESVLRDEIARWHALLPADLRRRPYTMGELLREFRASPMALGRSLAELGWVRKRNWCGSGPYIRYWTPPASL